MGREARDSKNAAEGTLARWKADAGEMAAFHAFEDDGCAKCGCKVAATQYCLGEAVGCPYPEPHIHRVCHQPAGGCGRETVEKCKDSESRLA